LIERISAVAEELGDDARVKEGGVWHVAPPLKLALDALIEGYP
jgi:hypothetical protein